MKKKKMKKKIHPYTQESLSIKDRQIKILLSLLEALLLLPLVNSIIGYLDVLKLNFITTLVVYTILVLISFILKASNKNLDFSKWIFLDDEFSIITDRKLNGEVSDVYVTKHVLVIVANILICIPISLTFSAILSNLVTFIIGFALNDGILEIIKFTLIFVIFKTFFNLINKIFIEYIKKKELD